MVPPLLIHVHSEGFEPAYQALTFALTARAMGQEVTLVFWFGALRALAEDRFGDPLPGPDNWSAQRGQNLGVPSCRQLLEEVRGLGPTLWACETVAKMAGVDVDDLAGKVEVVGLPQIMLRQQQSAQVLYL